MNFTITPLAIPDVLLIKTPVFGDSRGYFSEIFKTSAFPGSGLPGQFAQDNYSFSRQGVLRGLHFQRSPYAQGKLIRCLKGTIFDVAVDLRKTSPTFGQWVGHTLDDISGEMLYIPPAFAHGFLVLSPDALMLYKCTTEYAPGKEGGIRWDDPQLGIAWPSTSVILSEKDGRLPLLADQHWESVP